ncbi:hypothetical protein [Streptomyces sp. NPDC001980]
MNRAPNTTWCPLATAADCSPEEAAAPVARLLADLTAYGSIESP